MGFEKSDLTALECAQKCLESDYCAGIHLNLRYNYCLFLKYENGGTWNEADFYHRSKFSFQLSIDVIILFYFFCFDTHRHFYWLNRFVHNTIIIMKNNNIKLPTILLVHKAKYKFQSIATPRTSKK